MSVFQAMSKAGNHEFIFAEAPEAANECRESYVPIRICEASHRAYLNELDASTEIFFELTSGMQYAENIPDHKEKRVTKLEDFDADDIRFLAQHYSEFARLAVHLLSATLSNLLQTQHSSTRDQMITTLTRTIKNGLSELNKIQFEDNDTEDAPRVNFWAQYNPLHTHKLVYLLESLLTHGMRFSQVASECLRHCQNTFPHQSRVQILARKFGILQRVAQHKMDEAIHAYRLFRGSHPEHAMQILMTIQPPDTAPMPPPYTLENIFFLFENKRFAECVHAITQCTTLDFAALPDGPTSPKVTALLKFIAQTTPELAHHILRCCPPEIGLQIWPKLQRYLLIDKDAIEAGGEVILAAAQCILNQNKPIKLKEILFAETPFFEGMTHAKAIIYELLSMAQQQNLKLPISKIITALITASSHQTSSAETVKDTPLYHLMAHLQEIAIAIFGFATQAPKERQIALQQCSEIYTELQDIYLRCFHTEVESPEIHAMLGQCFEDIEDRQIDAKRHYQITIDTVALKQQKGKSIAHHSDALQVAQQNMRLLNKGVRYIPWLTF
ncbi:MAG: hypothetical protein O3A01_07525 [bacterium]|nr:hypothetical protein [bacterium]